MNYVRSVHRGLFFLFLLWLLGWPLFSLLSSSVVEKGLGGTLARFSNEILSSATLRTGMLAFTVASLSTVFGTALGWLLAFRPPRVSWVADLGLLVPLVLPNYVFAIAWTSLLGGWVYGFCGCVFILTLCWAPLVAFLSRQSFAGTETEIRTAARVDGASEWDLISRIDLPLAAPVLLTGFTLTFIFVLVEFGVPSLLLVHVSSFEVFTEFSAFYYPVAATLAGLPILALAVFMLGSERILRRGEPVHVLGTGTKQQAISSSNGRIFSISGLSLCLLPSIIPLGVLTYQAFAKERGEGLVRAFSLVNETIPISIGLCLVGGAILTIVGGALAVSLDKRLNPPLFRSSGLISEFVIMLLLAVPPALWSLGLLGYWNQQGLLKEWVTDSGLILAIGCLGRFLPVTYRIFRDGLEAVQTEIIEAAWLDGARDYRLTIWVLAPLLKQVAGVAFAIACVLSFGELTVTLFCAPPGVATLPVRLYTIMANSPTHVVASVALLVAAVCLPVAIGAPLLVRNESKSTLSR
jgi:iron(III) transport system permease protein